MQVFIRPDRASMVVEEPSGTNAWLDWSAMTMAVQVGGAGHDIWEGPLEVTTGTDTITIHREGHEDLTITPTLIDSMPMYDIPLGTRDSVMWTAESGTTVRLS
ncbi:hypothetical protein [Corynebacterium terpenotabidum]|uniref:Uncharacterized protein n=1 Tax=Corynebacterium terpenotabidum Y-11 TaxID=1200352 RepID=S4XAE1_9CORY|nr:hypothetical protein [Corynebacterium terpenotabidum]AGP30107.1 hypothetical protein A606_02270 [Corynebacterium terpenotabidum Y-11]